mgnify:CR=1 FL=1
MSPEQAKKPHAAGGDATPFRFYDNRQKYLAFVNTCNEKSAVAHRAAAELKHIRPTPPALRIFDAGMGDATPDPGLVVGGIDRERLVGGGKGRTPVL